MMRKMLQGMLAGTALILLSVTAHAGYIETTWVDEYTPDEPVLLNSSNKQISFTHDITNDGFTVGSDWVYSYSLSMLLEGNCSGFGCLIGDWAYIDLPGLVSDNLIEVNYSDAEAGWSLAGLLSLNATGTLDVTIKRLAGSFYFGGSTLTAQGKSPASVPEPGMLLLIGAGLAGLGLASRRRKSA